LSPELLIFSISISRLAFGIVLLKSRLLPKCEFKPKNFFPKTGSCREAAKNLKTSYNPKKKSPTRMEVKENFEVYGGAAKTERHNLTEPNQALQRMNVLVTDRAPSSTLRAKRVHR
jgi:hypothetical protein